MLSIKALNQFINTGFMLDKNNARLILVDEEKIYQFLSTDIEEYMKKYGIMTLRAILRLYQNI